MRVCLLVVAFMLSAASLAGAQTTSFSVMLWTLSKAGAYPQRVETAAAAGYKHVELVDEYQHWSEADWQKALAQLSALGVTVDAMAGVHAGFADPSAREQFLAELRGAIAAAHRLGSPQIILLSGPVVSALSPGEQHKAAIANLREAAPLLAASGLTAVIEPIDRLENPTIYLDSVEEAFAITEAVASPKVQVLYDVYHQQRTHGNLIENFQKHAGEVGLVHIADVPGRLAPGTGEIAYDQVYRALARLGYHGVIAMEFYPRGGSSAEMVRDLRSAREAAEQAMRGAEAH